MSYLKIDNLSAGYGKAVVIRDLDLEMAKDDAIAIVGRNGAGKSTLLMALFGMATVFSGNVAVDGQPLNMTAGFDATAKGLAVSPQGKLILPNLTVKENLLLGAASGRSGDWHVDSVCDLFPILGERHNKPGVALSGGQQQMLAIGRALMANPQILLLDEPTEGLAPAVIDDIVDALGVIRTQGIGLIVVEQHLNLVRRVADRFVVLSKGEILHQGSVDTFDSEATQSALAL